MFIPIADPSSYLWMDDRCLAVVIMCSTPEISRALIHSILKVNGCYPIMDLHNFITEFTKDTKHTKAIYILC